MEIPLTGLVDYDTLKAIINPVYEMKLLKSEMPQT